MLLLNGHSLEAVRKVPLESMSLKMTERDSTATIVPADMTGITVGAWLRDETDPGKGIVWRVTSISRAFREDRHTVQLEHAVSLLRDRILFGDIKTETLAGKTGATTVTAKKAVQYILAQSPDWALGTFDFDVSNPYRFDGDTLMDALETVSNSLDGCQWTFNFTVYPFRLNMVKKDADPASEMRAGRNIRTITRTVNTSGMYTRFYPIGKDDLHLPGSGYVEKNAGTYGVISKVETDQSIESVDELRRWANERLKTHSEPTLTIDIDGYELSAATGEPLDKMNLGRVMRVPLPEYGTTLAEEITALSYPDKIRQPEVVKVTLANNRTDVTKIIAEAIKNGSGGRAGRAAAKKAKNDNAWFEDTNEHVAMCAKGIVGVDAKGEPNWIRLSQIYVDGTGIAQTVTEVVNGQKTYESRLNQNERSIGMVVGKYDDGGNYIRAAEICAAINDDGSSQAMIKADKILLLGETIAQNVTADMVQNRIGKIQVLTVNTCLCKGQMDIRGYTYAPEYVIGSSSGGAGSNKYVSNAITELQVVPSGDNYKLQKKDFKDTAWVDCGTFSRATTLTGVWNGGRFIVSASPQGNQQYTDLKSVANADVSWSGRTGTFTVYAYNNGGETPVSTGKTMTVYAPFSSVSLAKAYNIYDNIYYGRLYDAAGNALTNDSYYWYGSNMNYDGGSASATFWRHT